MHWVFLEFPYFVVPRIPGKQRSDTPYRENCRIRQLLSQMTIRSWSEDQSVTIDVLANDEDVTRNASFRLPWCLQTVGGTLEVVQNKSSIPLQRISLGPPSFLYDRE